MNTCDKCRFLSLSNCRHGKNLYTNPFSGVKDFTLSATQQRTLAYLVGEQCGINGDWFEPLTPEILNCPEGHKAFVGLIQGGDNRVSCVKNGCWLAPSRPTKEEAIQVWNHMVKSLRNTPDE